MMLFKNDITHVTGALQLSAWQDARVEAVLHVLHDIFSEENTDVVLLIENSFSSINRKVMHEAMHEGNAWNCYVH